MKYLIPAISQFLIAMMFKYPQHLSQFSNNLQEIIKTLMMPDIRMEPTAMLIASAVFEKLGVPNPQFLHDFLLSVFTCLHFYRNNTKNKVIPVTITKAIWSCFSNIMIYHGTSTLVGACNKIQPDIMFMILKSEGDKIKHITTPPRDKKYAIMAYTQFMQDTL
jgi:hypothetical protein